MDEPARPVDALRLVLGDQLSPNLASLRGADPARDVVLLVEVAEETTYVRHHRKKIAFILAAMRAFADELRAAGFRVDHVALDDPANTGTFTGELARAVARHRPARIETTMAGEHRVVDMQRAWAETFDAPVAIHDDDRFICPLPDFRRWAMNRTQMRMENFYRDMRRRTGVLMTEEGDPVGGRWNFDAENRKPAPRDLFMPRPLAFAPDARTQAVIDMVARLFPDGFGDLDGFALPTTRAQAEAARDHFMATALPRFGDYQDAMLTGEPFLWHSVLSPAMNAGLLDPLDVCRRAEIEHRAGRAPLNAVEGFIRQILGWREYVRGVYWVAGPDYVDRNALDATRPLPWFYWSAETKMACMAQALGQTKREAYAHHIQRLMVTGNFALLAGLSPKEVHEWYLAVYADAYEWVEAPNTLGMALFADGGMMASKPYAASGAYIDRMSDHCGRCSYDVKAKTGPNACPFNPLYWDFMDRNRARLGSNPRLGPVYRTWDRMDEARKAETRASAAAVLAAIDTL